MAKNAMKGAEEEEDALGEVPWPLSDTGGFRGWQLQGKVVPVS